MPCRGEHSAVYEQQHMSDFHVRSDNVDVEQIMRQIRSRIREKRGVDYTEEEIRELANVKLEKFLDPRGRALGSARAVPAEARGVAAARNFAFEDTTLYESHRGFLRVHAAAAAADPEAVLQPQPAHRGAAHPVEAERRSRPRSSRCTTR